MRYVHVLGMIYVYDGTIQIYYNECRKVLLVKMLYEAL